MRMSALLFAMWTPLRVDQAALNGVGTAVAFELAICRRPLLWTGREAWSFHLCAGMTADCAVWPGRLASCTSGRQLFSFQSHTDLDFMFGWRVHESVLPQG